MDQLTVVGWREIVSLPELGLEGIKAKVDTGARTSALHAFDIERFQKDGQEWLTFKTHPVQHTRKPVISCEARLQDERVVTDSGDHREKRFVIETPIEVGEKTWRVEVTLTDRKNMKFRMLLGRHAMRGKITVDPARSYLTTLDK